GPAAALSGGAGPARRAVPGTPRKRLLEAAGSRAGGCGPGPREDRRRLLPGPEGRRGLWLLHVRDRPCRASLGWAELPLRVSRLHPAGAPDLAARGLATLAPAAETVHGRFRAHEDAAVRDGGGRHDRLPEVARRDDLPVGPGPEHRDLAVQAREVDLAVAG